MIEPVIAKPWLPDKSKIEQASSSASYRYRPVLKEAATDAALSPLRDKGPLRPPRISFAFSRHDLSTPAERFRYPVPPQLTECASPHRFAHDEHPTLPRPTSTAFLSRKAIR